MRRLFYVFCMCLMASAVAAQDTMPMHHPPQDMQLHIKYYQYWQRPNGKGSCCNENDCYPTQARFDPKTGTWWAMRREDNKWIEIPKWIYDNNDPNRPESPDGQSHLCAPPPFFATDMTNRNLGEAQSPSVYCFRAGTGM